MRAMVVIQWTSAVKAARVFDLWAFICTMPSEERDFCGLEREEKNLTNMLQSNNSQQYHWAPCNHVAAVLMCAPIIGPAIRIC